MRSDIRNWYPLLFAIVAVVGLLAGAKLHESLAGDGLWISRHDSSADDQSISMALSLIEEKYYGKLDEEKFSATVIKEMMSELDDYSGYLDDTHDGSYSRYIRGAYMGRGLDVHPYAGHTITRVLSESPAEKAGLRRGDRIVSIDGIEVGNVTHDSLSAMLYVDRPIDVSVMRDDRSMDVSIDYGEVAVPIVRSHRIVDSDVTYVVVRRFSHGVFRLIMDELDKYKKSGYEVSDIIFDLRDNPGGVVEEVAMLLNQLVAEPNTPLFSTVSNKGKKQEYDSNGRTFFDIERVVCIINEQSASCSEIMAGALQDLDRGVIVGRESYGKGFIQQNFKLPNSSSITLTVGEYLLPSGRKIRPTGDTTAYTSVRMGRKLPKGGAVSPDVLLSKDSCVVSKSGARDMMMRHLIDEGLIDDVLLSLEQMSDIADDMSIGYTKDDACRIGLYAQLMGMLTETYYEEVSHLSALQMDDAIQEAIDIITTDRYSNILHHD